MSTTAWKNFRQRIADGRGQGVYDAYKPWGWIRRQNASSRGNQVAVSLPGLRRECHFMKARHWHIALACKYLGAEDVREMLPIWPQPHAHPLAAYCEAGRRLPSNIGLAAIAARCGIPHPMESDGEVPKVVCIDLMVTIRRTALQLLAISVTPFPDRQGIEAADDPSASIRLVGLAMEVYRVRHRLVSAKTLCPTTTSNLVFFSSAHAIPSELFPTVLQEDFISCFLSTAATTSVSESISRAGRTTKLSTTAANLLFRHLTWRRRLEIDMTVPLRLDRPFLRADNAAAALAERCFGEALS